MDTQSQGVDQTESQSEGGEEVLVLSSIPSVLRQSPEPCGMFLWGEEGGREGRAGQPQLECYSFCSPEQLPERLACGSR